MANATHLYIWQIQVLPDQIYDWRSQWITHGMNGYHHIGYVDAAYVASANVTLTISARDGNSAANITLPSTANNYQRVFFRPTFNKGMEYRYSANSANAFQFVLSDWVVGVKPWGSLGPYQPYRLLGEG